MSYSLSRISRTRVLGKRRLRHVSNEFMRGVLDWSRRKDLPEGPDLLCLDSMYKHSLIDEPLTGRQVDQRIALAFTSLAAWYAARARKRS